MSDAESYGRQTAKVSIQLTKEQRCPNPAIVKTHKLIKLSCHPFARFRKRDFLLSFIDMRGSQSHVVHDVPQVSAACGWTYKYETNSSRQQLSHRSCRPERFFHAPCPERISKMTESSVHVFFNGYLHLRLIFLCLK
jgi:hypothetical protein